MIRDPQPGERIVMGGNRCLVVTSITKGGAIEYDELELRIHGAGKDAQKSWRKVSEWICDRIMWTHYRAEGRML